MVNKNNIQGEFLHSNIPTSIVLYLNPAAPTAAARWRRYSASSTRTRSWRRRRARRAKTLWERPFPWANPRSRSRMCSLKVSIVHIVCVVAVVAGIGSGEADLWRPESINTICATTIIIIIDPPFHSSLGLCSRWLCDGVSGQGQLGALCPETHVRDRWVPKCGQAGDPDSCEYIFINSIVYFVVTEDPLEIYIRSIAVSAVSKLNLFMKWPTKCEHTWTYFSWMYPTSSSSQLR